MGQDGIGKATSKYRLAGMGKSGINPNQKLEAQRSAITPQKHGLRCIMHKAGEPHADVINLVGHLHEYQDKVEAVIQSQTQLLESIESVQNGTRWLLDLEINAQSTTCTPSFRLFQGSALI